MNARMLPSNANGDEGQSGRQRQKEHDRARHQQRAGIVAELTEDRLLGGTARAAFRHQQTGSQRNDQRRDLRNKAVANR